MKILLTGDSIISRYEGKDEPRLNYELKKIMKISIINTAIPGINSKDFFENINNLILDQIQCDTLAILLGTNDLAIHKQVPLSQFSKNLKLISSAIIYKYLPTKVILITPPAVDETKQYVRTNTLVAQYSEVINRISIQYHFHYLNLYKSMIKNGNLIELCHGLKNDGLHFGTKGYRLLANLLRQELLNINNIERKNENSNRTRFI